MRLEITRVYEIYLNECDESMGSKVRWEQRVDGLPVAAPEWKTRVQSFEKLGTTLGGESNRPVGVILGPAQSTAAKWIVLE